MILISDSATYLHCKDGDFETTTMEDGPHRFTLKYQVGKNEKLTLAPNEAVVRRFGLEFKSKVLPYGVERLRTDDAYNLGICSRTDCGKDGFPKLPKASAKPNELQGFNYTKSTPSDQKHCKGCHFFIDDYQFERLWNSPSAHLGVLRGYDCVLTPDFSLYMDMPDPMQQWNRYRSVALGRYWAENGLAVIPTLSWAQPSNYRFCFKGISKHSTVATSTVGVARDKDAQEVWYDGMREAMKRLEPSLGAAFLLPIRDETCR